MATTLQALKTYYSNVMVSDFAHIPTAHQALLTDLSTQIDAGTLTVASARSQVINLAAGTTSVASLTYSFFTGGTPSEGGFQYLVSASGDNATNLNSAFYQSFTTENRYINFAVNLGQAGEGKAWFAANYGALSLSDTLIKAYAAIFGAPPDAAKVDAILNAAVPNGVGGSYTRAEYFASYGGDGLTGVGTKAALIGWLMSEAVKADVGVYANANDAFLADLGDDGVASFRSDLLAAYGAGDPGTAGVALTVAGDKSISPSAADPALKSTAGNDTIVGTAGLNPAIALEAGAGRDTINLTGAIYGLISTADGGDTVTLGALGVSPPAGGVPVQYGTVTLGANGNVVTLKGGMAQGTSLTAAGTGNVLHVQGGLAATYEGAISGFQTVYYHSTRGPAVSGASVLYVVIDDPADTAAFRYSAYNHETVVLKDTGNAIRLTVPAAPATGANLDLHLQNYHGAATTGGDGYVSPGGPVYNYEPDGGSIGFFVRADGASDPNATLTLHVDSDSTAGLLYGWSTNAVFGPNYRGPEPKLIITGAGKLTAQVAFANVDATQASDLNLTYDVSVYGGQTLRLGDGSNLLNLLVSASTGGTFDPIGSRIHLGAGVDTIKLAQAFYPGVTEVTTLSNLHLTSATTVGGPPEIIGFQKGVDHLVLDAVAHAATADVQAYADGKASLAAALIAVSAHVSANTIAVFTWGGDTYVYAQDAVAGLSEGSGALPGDGLIKLTGVTGLTVGTGAGSYDIHYG